jgi:hypothetical protein
MDRAHLIPKARIKKEFPHGAWVAFSGVVMPVPRRTNVPADRTQREVVWDNRVLVAACRAHHSAWDNRVFNIARGEVPAACEEYAEEYGLVWSLDRDYGERR